MTTTPATEPVKKVGWFARQSEKTQVAIVIGVAVVYVGVCIAVAIAAFNHWHWLVSFWGWLGAVVAGIVAALLLVIIIGLILMATDKENPDEDWGGV